MNPNFDYEGAKKAGYSDDEIKGFLTQNQKTSTPEKQTFFGNIKKNIVDSFFSPKKEENQDDTTQIDQNLLRKIPNFDVQGAINSGYTAEEINDFLEDNQPKRSALETGARTASQYALGAVQGSPPGFAYDTLVAPLGSSTFQDVNKRQILGEIQEDIMQGQPENFSELIFGKSKKSLTEKEQSELKNIKENLEKHPEMPTNDLSIKGIAEKVTGIDFHPENWLEKSAQWAGFIKDPKKIMNLKQAGLNPLEITKTLLPTAKETMRGATAGAALELAEQGQFGPLGTLLVAFLGDVAGHGPSATLQIAKNPKQSLAQFTNFITRDNSKTAWKQEFIRAANDAGIQIDVGSLTDKNFIKMLQAHATASGLSGESLENFKQQMSDQIMREYEKIISYLGETKFENDFQASEALKESMKVQEMELNLPKIETDKSRSLQGRVSVQDRPDYQMNLLENISPVEFTSSGEAGEILKNTAEEIKAPIKETFDRRWTDFKNEVKQIPTGPQGRLGRELRNFVEDNRGSLLLGESTAEYAVIRAAENLANRLLAEGGELGVSLNELMQTKTTLGDVANFEFGGSNFESKYQYLVTLVDEAIQRTLQEHNPQLLESFRNLNSEYSQYKNIFENKNVIQLFEPKNRNFNAIHNGFATNPDKLRALEQILSLSPQGENVLNGVKRDFANKIITNQNVTNRQIRDLSNVLGERFNEPINRFLQERQFQLDNPRPIPQNRPRLGVEVQAPTTQGGKPLSGRIKESGTKAADLGQKKKMYDFLKNKESKQIMKLMDSVEGIRKLRRVLNLTEEGKQLFNELSRYKLADILDKNMKNEINGKIKLGTFSNLLKSKENKAIVKELIGNENFIKLRNLQDISGKLAESANRFLNTSKSGTTLVDMGLIGAAATGILTGNPFMAIPAIGKIGGTRVIATLFADKEFLKYLEKAILTDNPKKYTYYLEKMRPSVEKAVLQTSRSISQPDSL